MFVRTDLSFLQQAVQACHAAIEAGRHALFSPGDEHPHLVLCGTPSLVALECVIARLVRLAIAHRAFFEPDLGGQLTAVCTAPLRGPTRRALRRYSLLTCRLSPNVMDIHAASRSHSRIKDSAT